MSTVKNPKIPCEIPIPDGVTVGSMITVQGTVPQTANRFSVNLLCRSGDIALAVTPKFRENYVARNSVTHMTWGKEESAGGLPIYPGQSFEIIILCEEDDFKIAFNGNHYAEFAHRISFSKISSVEVEGDVIVDNIHFGGESSSVSGISNPSSASYGFQPRAPSPYANTGGASSSGGVYPTVPPEPSYPTAPGPFPSAPTSGGGLYPAGSKSPSPSPFPSAPVSGGGMYPTGPNSSSPGPFPSAPTSGGGMYPTVPPQLRDPSPGPYPSGPGGIYPSPQPNYPPGPYPASSGGYYPQPGPPPPGPYPSSGSHYPQQPGYGPGTHHGQYPQVPDQGSYNHNAKQKSKSNDFLNQAGMAIAGILGPALLAKGLRKAQGTGQGQNQGQSQGHGRGGPDLLGQAAGTLAGLLGGAGLSGYNHHKHGVLGGALGTAVAGAALTGHLNPIKAAKKQKKAQKKALKYGLPIVGAGLGAYALQKGLKKGFRRGSSSSSSGSSSD